jgi:hypothetical protein
VKQDQEPISTVATARQRAIDAVQQLRRENAPRISDIQWTSYTGYNYGRWADKGFNIVLGLLNETVADPGEMGPAYLRRICDAARQVREDYRNNAADEDGACSGAIDAAIWAMLGLLPPTASSAQSVPLSWEDPAPDVPWQLWYTDLFDRESPPAIELQGLGLAKGLAELWTRFLFEEVSPGGGLGLSRFHIWSQQRSILVEGEWAGAAQLRHWLYGAQARDRQRSLVAGGDQILHKIGVIHAQLLREGVTSQPILDAALGATNLTAFEAALDELARP